MAEKEIPLAIRGLRAFRDRLAAEIPEFRQAVDAEAEAEAFCRSMREQLRGLRKDLRVDQAALGQVIGLTQSAVSRIERGTGDIGLKTLFRYARALERKPFVTFTVSAGSVVEEVKPSAAAEAVKNTAAALDDEHERYLQAITRAAQDYFARNVAIVQEADSRPVERKSLAAAG
jgi:transcriptional regulator with XRE-family HTH domain